MFIRCISRVLLFIASVPSITDQPVHAQERAYLTKAEVEQTLVGKGIISRNLATGMISHWKFVSNGSVEFINRSGPGNASGTWTLHGDGLMCVTMSYRTGCRYWFRTGDTFANTSTRESHSPTIAEVVLE